LKILITNDDGIYAPGLNELKNGLEKFNKVMAIAPDQERSGSGCCASIYRTIRCKKVLLREGSEGYSVSGTPVDCVVVGLEKIYKNEKPELVISGINAGENLGQDILYSGTVGAAIEASYHGIPSIAVSIEKKEHQIYSTAIRFVQKFVRTFPFEIFHYSPIVLNINFPNIPYSKIKGIKLTRLAKIFHQKKIKSIYKSYNEEYFWIEGSRAEGEIIKNTDYWAIRNNYISITVFSLEFPQNKSHVLLKKWIKCMDIEGFTH